MKIKFFLLPAIIAMIFLLTVPAPAQALYPAVKGAWLTNVDSDALRSKANIAEAVALCDSLGINTLFVVVWNKAMTLYPSSVMKEMFGEEIDPSLAGRDPLKELIEEAHKKNISVIAWFEFGLSSSYKLNGGRILKLKPEWKALNNKGELVEKNGFEWMNGINPEVQDFILSIIREVVRNYDIDGIQGDDRLPAMPVEAGYENYTIQLYKQEHQGTLPPENFRDAQWIDWRSGKLNDFMQRIYRSVKDIKPNVIVSMSPSIFPWSKEEYLQDWPQWLRQGVVDMVCPQLYRFDINEYVRALDEVVNSQINKKDLAKFYPGVLLKLGSYYAPEDYLKSVIEENRKRGVQGEVFFFYEGLKKYPDLFRKYYKIPETAGN
ncbi:MAG: glycoside hydrolase family 10 protein [Acidobacteriota bacterium]